MLSELLTSFLLLVDPAGASELTRGEKDAYLQQQSYCLAQNVYYEARNQPAAGQLAVVSVTLNRVADDRFPNTVCDVVYEGPHRPSWKGTGEMIPVRNRCQFSWYCDGKGDEPLNNELFDDLLILTYEILSGSIKIMDITEGATHYHADYVRPAWAETKTKTIEIEDHIFYRWER